MNEEELNKKAIEDYEKRLNEKDPYEEELKKAKEEETKRIEDTKVEEDGGFFDEGSAFRTTAAIGTEVALNTLLDLFSFEPTSQVGGAAAINYFAQRIRGGEISKGEMAAAGLASLIPGGAQAKSLGGVLGKGAAKGAVSGVIETGVADLIDTRQVNPENLAFGALVGGGFGSAFSLVGSQPEVQRAVKYFKGRIRGDAKISPEDALELGLGQPMAYMTPTMSKFPTAKQLLTQLPKGAGFDTDTVNDYVTRAFVHREKRVMMGGKQNLMKDFSETLKNKSGQDFILVKKTRLRNSQEPAAIENYDLRSVKDVELEAAAQIGFDYQIGDRNKYLKMIVSELNKRPEIAQNPKLYLSTLMEYGDRAYLEHKIARRMNKEFWQRVEARNPKDVTDGLFQWTGATRRNNAENLRLLLDPNYKTLKDTTEGRLETVLKKRGLKTDDAEAFVIDIEDPNDAIFGSNSLFVRSNPGNIQIRKAGTGEVVGIIPDFYRQIYSTQFKTAFGKTKALQSPDVPELIRALPGESITDYRNRIVFKMLDDAVSGKTTMLGREERYLQELADFYNTFEKLEKDTKLSWVRKPSWVNDILTGKNKFGDPAEADIEAFSRKDELGIIRDKEGKVIELDVDTEADLKQLKELEDLLRNLPRETKGRYKGSILTSKRKIARDLRKDIDAIRKRYNLGKYQFVQKELNI